MALGHQVGVYRYDDASLESDKFEKIGRVTALSGVGIKVNTTDAKFYDDADDEWTRVEAVSRDGGELTITIRYRDGNAQAVELEKNAYGESDGDEQLKLQWPSIINRKIIISGIVTGWEYGSEKEGIHEVTMTFKVNGKPQRSALA